MAVNKQAFHESLVNTLKDPDNQEYREQAGKMITSLAQLLANKLRLPQNFKKDAVADAVLRAWVKRTSARPSRGNYFNFFWTMLYHDLKKMQVRERRFYSRNILFGSKTDPLEYLKQDAGDYNLPLKGGHNMSTRVEEQNLKDLNINLDSYKTAEVNAGTQAEAVPAGAQRKRYKTRSQERFSNGVAISLPLWEGFVALKEKKSMTEKELLAVSAGRVKNEDKNYVPYVKHVARDRGFIVATNEVNGETVVTLTDPKSTR